MPIQWTVVDCRSHTHFEPYTYGNDATSAWAGFEFMAKNAIEHNTTRQLALYNNKGKLVASFNYSAFKD